MERATIDDRRHATTLATACKGFRGRVVGLVPASCNGRLATDEMERRLLEMGFIEGAEIEVLHEGPFGRDPIAVRIGSGTIALRRRDATAIVAE